MNYSFLNPSIILIWVFLIYLLCGFLARRVGGAKGGRPFSDFLYGPFILPLDESRVTRNLEIARILLGCFIVHRYLDCFGTAVIGNTEAIRLTMATGVFFGVSIAIGFLTPVVIVLYSSLFLIFPTYISTLGNQVALLTLWVMILLGAGKIWSVDSLMMKWKATRPSIEALYFFSVSPTPENFARVRFFALLIFWGINFSAIGFHFLDEFWLGGDVLQVAMTAGFWNDHFQLFNVLKDKFPLWFDGFCKLGLYIQAFFETFLLPLMFLGWPGRFFVFLQGLSFFTVSLFCINLGYLPVHELILWGILFGYLPAILPFLNRTKGKGRPIMENRFPSHPLDALIVVAFIVCVTFNLVNLASINGSMFPRKWPWTHILWRTTYRSLGLEAVNVFNRDDLKTGSYRIVLFEVNEDGEPIRLVPLMDLNGARLDYLRNDYIYFRRVLTWLRSPESQKFEGGDYHRFSTKTQQVIDSIIKLDATLTGLEPGRIYRVEIGRRALKDGDRFVEWGPWESLVEKEFRLDPKVAENLVKERPLTFNLPPGHWGSEARAWRSLEILKQRQPSTLGQSD